MTKNTKCWAALALLLASLSSVLGGCETSERTAPATSVPTAASASPSSVPSASAIKSASTSKRPASAFPPQRTDAQIQQLASDLCRPGLASNRAFLVEFSAPWCRDCNRLNRLKKHSEMQRELSHWTILRINVGEFDQNEKLLAAFKISAIANWVALAPKDCSAPLAKWPRVARRVVEPATGPPSDANVRKLWSWLKHARAQYGP